MFSCLRLFVLSLSNKEYTETVSKCQYKSGDVYKIVWELLETQKQGVLESL